MKKFLSIALLLLLVSGVSVYAAPKDDAKAMTNKAVAFFKAKGKDAAISEIQKKDGQFVKGEVYIYIFTDAGIVLAHPMLPNFVGKNFMDIKDADGKYFIKESLEALKTKDEVWVKYKWNNPTTKKIGSKISLFKKVGDMVFACGVWE